MAVTVHARPEDAAAWLAARLRAHVGAQLCSDSRALRPGDGFIAWPGRASDGRRHVAPALAAGAAACLVEAEGLDAFGVDDPRISALSGLKAAAGTVADLFYGQPSARLDVVATTGTNGKTSTAWWTAQALTALGRRCGVVGTLGIGEPPTPTAPARLQSSGLTTPDAIAVQQAFHRFVDAGYAACAIEASSIGLAEHRLAGAQIAVALFTNLTQDHLDYHGSLPAYWQAKQALFRWPGLRAAVLNVDDAHGAALAAELAAARATHGVGDAAVAPPSAALADLWTVSLRGPARLVAEDLHYTESGLAFTACERSGSALQRAPVRSALVGEFNAANLLLVLAGLRALGVPLADAAATAAVLTPVPGRLQRVPAAAGGDVEVVVDYAHTPDALEQVLKALRPMAAARGGRLWCVFGCGGNRDATKRPLMGAIAAAGADRVVITSDNPRDEAPQAILAQVLAGVTGHDEVDVIEDRRAAIVHAVQSAAPGDVLLLAGKGHEDCQEIAGVKRPFSDLLEAQAALRARSAGGRA